MSKFEKLHKEPGKSPCIADNFRNFVRVKRVFSSNCRICSFIVKEERVGYVRLVQIRDFSTDRYKVYVPDTPNLRHFDVNDVLIARYGASLGKICTGLAGVYNVALAKVFFSEDVLYSKYVYWMLHSDFFQEPLTRISRTAQVGFNKSDLSGFRMPLPPLPEQRRVVERIESLFTKLDEVRDKARAVLDGYEYRRAAILHKAFTGELTAQWRKVNGRGAGAWKTVTFRDVAEVKSNLVSPFDYPDYPHIAPDNIEKKTGVLLDYRTISEDGIQSSNHLFHAGQILYSKIRPNLSKVVMVDFDGLCSADMYPIEPKPGVDTVYLWYYMLSNEFFHQVLASMKGSLLPRIRQKDLSGLKVRITDYEEQRVISRIIRETLDDEWKVKESAEAVLTRVDLMKKAILGRAFRGLLGTNHPEEPCAAV